MPHRTGWFHCRVCNTTTIARIDPQPKHCNVPMLGPEEKGQGWEYEAGDVVRLTSDPARVADVKGISAGLGMLEVQPRGERHPALWAPEEVDPVL